MPFAKRSTHTLTLAISAALLSHYSPQLLAQSEQDTAWSCTQNSAGEWDCEVNEILVKQAESAPVTTATETAAEPVQPATEQVNIETAAPAAPQPARPTVRPEVTTAKTATPPSTEPSKATAPAATAAVTSGRVIDQEWNCESTTDGRWDCSNEPVYELVTQIGAQPTLTTAQVQFIKDNPYQHLDWVYYGAPSQMMCPGQYLEPVFPPQGDENLADPPLYVDAASSSTELGGLTRLEGGVNMRQGRKRVSANYAELDQVTNKTRFEGNVRYREPGMLVLANTAQVDNLTQEGAFTDTEYVMHQEELRGTADRIFYLADGRMRLEQSSYTYCPPFSEAWVLEADNMMLDQAEGVGVARDAVLRVAGVPIFYTPYLSFPIDDRRKSGFLYPSLSYSKENGIDLAVPYYFNIAANMDDTFTPRLIGERGLMLENEFRYMNRWSHNMLSTSFLDDDELGEQRWLLGINHEGTPVRGWRSEIDFTSVSDSDFFSDLDTNLEVRRKTHLDQRADLAYKATNWSFVARVHEYQTIKDDIASPYEKLPQLLLNGNYELSEDASVGYAAEYVNFQRDIDDLSGFARVTGERRFLMPTLSYEWRRPWAYVKPELRLWSSSYSLDDQLTGRDESPSINVPITSLDSGLFFERDLDNGGIQTLEPRLFLLHVPEEDQSDIPRFDTALIDFSYSRLFRYNRFSGRDRIGDAKQASVGIGSRFLAANGAELFSVGVGQAFYFDDRDVTPGTANEDRTRSQSDLATYLGWQLSQNWRVSLNAILDQSDFKNTESNVRLRYNSNLNQRIDLSYRFEDDVREQADLSFILPVANHWTSFGRWLQDMQENELLEAVLGLEYESCCWKISLAGRRWQDDDEIYDSGAFLTLTLKGLGALGSGSNGFLEDITGYEEREEHYDE
ncbi:LPS-assembly protein LptD [Pontibacter sp. JAM-7]|uniref:LPS-assembly protein LptD n=1 Tax=Pontibacter sp. JAM-7 TaxID=3366581 RepID=UPI003AF600A8